jgi:hypothetical protein
VAAGTVAKFFGDKQAESAKNRTFDAERQRQQRMSDEQQARFADSLKRTQDTTDPHAVQKAADDRSSSLAAAITPTSTEASYLPGSSSAPTVVGAAKDTAAKGSAATSAKLAKALGALGGFNDQMQGLNIGIGRDSQQIGQISGFKAGSAGVLDSELNAASQKGSFLRGLGSLASSIGSAWLAGGGGGLGGAGGAGGGTSLGAVAGVRV